MRDGQVATSHPSPLAREQAAAGHLVQEAVCACGLPFLVRAQLFCLAPSPWIGTEAWNTERLRDLSTGAGSSAFLIPLYCLLPGLQFTAEKPGLFGSQDFLAAEGIPLLLYGAHPSD